MAETKRKKGESFESLLRRFKKKIQQSGVLLQSRKIRYYERPKSKNKRRNDTLRRLEINSEREYLKKIGRLKEDDFTTTKRRT